MLLSGEILLKERKLSNNISLFAANYPIARKIKKITLISNEKTGINANTGPGHKSASPQPTPKILPPSISFQSISLDVGTSNLSYNIGFSLFNMTELKEIKLNPTADTITNIREAL